MAFGSSEYVARDLARKIEACLSRIGLLHRVFYRVKSERSLARKLVVKDYETAGRRMQDLIGIRVTLYFSDDLEIVRQALKSIFCFVDEEIDRPGDETFRPTRMNMIFRLDAAQTETIRPSIGGRPVDNTFEVQVRTVMAEGWHEVEHDLRYKCRDDWENASDLSRALNGVMATLETCEWSMLQLFDDLAHRHYRNGNWLPMLRHRFRVRLASNELSGELRAVLDGNPRLAKKIYRASRGGFVRALLHSSLDVQLTPNTLVFLLDHLVVRSGELASIRPPHLDEELLNAGLLDIDQSAASSSSRPPG